MTSQQGSNLEICSYTYNQEGEKKRGQAAEVCQSHKGNDLHPSDASASTVLAGVVRKA